jgi:hypothetical protein
MVVRASDPAHPGAGRLHSWGRRAARARARQRQQFDDSCYVFIQVTSLTSTTVFNATYDQLVHFVKLSTSAHVNSKPITHDQQTDFTPAEPAAGRHDLIDARRRTTKYLDSVLVQASKFRLKIRRPGGANCQCRANTERVANVADH